MKFISAVNVLTLASVAPGNNNIDAHSLQRHSKSTAAMLLVGQSQLFRELVTAVDLSFGRPSTPNIKDSSQVIIGMECSFGVDSSARAEEQQDYEQIDLGVLGVCDDEEYICVEDKGSSMGGRCVLRTGDFDEGERELKITCEKCVGYYACYKANQDKIGCNSCHGDNACFKMYGTVDENSCNGNSACSYGQNLRSVGKNSCNGVNACLSSNGTVADYSCSDNYACWSLNGTTIGSHSCNNRMNCYHSSCPVIGNYECNAQSDFGECTYSDCPQPVTLSPTKSPNALPSKFPSMSPSSSPSKGPTISPSNGPSVSPSKSPSKSPSASPSNRPSMSPSKSPSQSPTQEPSKPPSVSPSKSPSSSPFFTPSTRPPSNTPTMSPMTNCFPRASKVKLQSITSRVIQVFEVKVYSSVNDVAAGKSATQSSLYNNKTTFSASKAVDGKENTFSHTASSDEVSWWQVDLGGMFPIESVKILNRWCQNPGDPTSCLCRLSHVVVVFFDNQGKWVYSNLIGDTCNVAVYTKNITGSTEYCTA